MKTDVFLFCILFFQPYFKVGLGYSGEQAKSKIQLNHAIVRFRVGSIGSFCDFVVCLVSFNYRSIRERFCSMIISSGLFDFLGLFFFDLGLSGNVFVPWYFLQACSFLWVVFNWHRFIMERFCSMIISSDLLNFWFSLTTCLYIRERFLFQR